MSQSQMTSGSGQLSLPAVMVFASASIPIAALVLAITVHLPRYFASHLGLSLAVVGGAFALVRFVDIPLDAGLGLAMDRTRTRFGRYRVWLALGAPVLMLAMYMLMISPEGVGQGYLIGWLLVMYVGYSGVYLSHLAWAGRLAPTYEQRNRVFGAITGLGVIGAMGVLLIPVVMTEYVGASDAESVRAMIWFIIGSTAVTSLLVIFASPEVISKDHGSTFGLKDYWSLLTRPNILRLLAADLFVTLGPGWMASMYLFYFTDSRGFTIASANLLLMIYIAAGFAGAPFAAWLANRLSKHRALMVTTTIYSLGLITVPFLPAGNFFIFAPGMFLLGAMAAGFTVLIRAITADIADEIRLDSGREWMGLMYAMTTATSKLATAGAIFLTFNVLAAVGYQAQEGATNTAEAIFGLELAYILGPIVFVMIAGACFFGYRLTAERHAEIRRLLDEKDALVDPAAAMESLTGTDIAHREPPEKP
ncbi:MFS transporter [Phenylobacterium sp. SCN 70-31]|uniref:MFS transporter n=1 Tax=Phenylobacterium sp. SCN 70-31 TaxID=1660129 RepID=UPI000B2CA585|nr:MFS transporter [Phenylobacterium sp. SCN 70-31]